MKTLSLILVLLVCLSCTYKIDFNSSDAEEDIRDAEANFNQLAQSKGIATAFATFADADAVILREKDTLIKGNENIKNYYSSPKFLKAKVTWSPDFVSVSKDGTLGYTYGKYTWTVTDSLGKSNASTGIFHTVWKKQTDGSWKYVWD